MSVDPQEVGRVLARRSRAAQGLSEHVEEPGVVRRVGRLLRGRRPADVLVEVEGRSGRVAS